MNDPIIEVVPLCSAACSDSAIALDVLVAITPPRPDVHFVRPPINLALVLDRSGSMAGGRKMGFARDAAVFAVEQLLPTDIVSVTTYDNEVETIVPAAPAGDKPGIVRRIREVQPRGATDLHAGWKAGADQAAAHAVAGINRVVLLSDGQANAGVVDPNAIVADVRASAGRGVATTTLGVGDDYNEDLMEGMARGGEGNYYFISDPVQLADIFQTEMHDLLALIGGRVSLGVEASGGVAVADVLNDYDRAPTGRLKLPNLVVGMPILAVVRLSVPPRPGRGPVCRFRLAWDPPRGGGRRALHAALNLPAVSLANWEELDRDARVVEQVALLMSARARREAVGALERGDLVATRACLAWSYKLTASAPSSHETSEDLEAIARAEADLDEGHLSRSAKRLKQQVYARRQGKDLS